LIESVCSGENWDFNCEADADGKKLALQNPSSAACLEDSWLYAGPFSTETMLSAEEVTKFDTVFATENGPDYWHVDQSGMYVRPYLESRLYGQWNYPLGVTLYGLLQTALLTNRHDIVEYIKNHVEVSTGYLQYALWDVEKYGKSGFNLSLSDIVSLDDCGSFASLLLELSQYAQPKGGREAVDFVADYISNKQIRLEDGAFYRINPNHAEMNFTMWLDDLYMSTPFLCRYFKLTGDRKYIDDAANQFLLFKKYLYMPEEKLCAHVYYADRKINTGIPWGRGNGWVLFSLSELLDFLPEGHEKREELTFILMSFAKGISHVRTVKACGISF
jgi:unsaturated rhamnogalacturonyl hydrolase